jgi:hypothetical protein
MDKMPHPPFPDRDRLVLKMIVDGASGRLGQGLDARTVVLHAALYAWMEGHLEGHYCSGDEEEPGDPRIRQAMREGRRADAEAIAREMDPD